MASAASAPAPASRTVLLTCAAVVLLAVALYGRTAGFDFTRTDDQVLIIDDAPFLSSLGNVPAAFGRTFFHHSSRGSGYYRPLVTVTLMTDAAISGTRPTAYHVTNVALHALACCLLLLVLLRLDFPLVLAAPAAALFAVHPALTEAVAWIPGRVDILLAICALAAMLCLLRWRRTGATRWLGAHVLLVFGALLCKEAAVGLPLGFAAYLALDENGRKVLRRPHLWVAWGTALLAWMVVWRQVVLDEESRRLGDYISVGLAHLPVLLMHLGKVVCPHQLAVLAIARDTSWVAGAVALVALAASAVLLPGRCRRLVLWGGIWFMAFVLPSLPVSDALILENRLYLPAIGVAVALLAVVEHARLRLAAHRAHARFSPALGVGAAVVALLFAVLSWRYTGSFRDREAFTAQAVRTSPHSALAHLNRGIVYHRQGQAQEAEARYHEALRLNEQQPVVHNNLGLILMNRGELAEAERHFRRELQIDPAYDVAHYNLGLALQRRGREDEAARSFARAIEVNPRHLNALGELARYHSGRNEPQLAAQYTRRMEALGAKLLPPQPGGGGAQ